MANETILTKEGLQKLQDELDWRKSTEQQNIAERLKAAIALGDLSENSEYDEAKNAQAFNEGRIQTLEALLKNVKVIEEETGEVTDVKVGVSVTLEDMETHDVEEYEVVGTQEADPMADPPRISNESPVGKAIMGKEVDTVVKITTPAGEFDYKIVGIRRNSGKKTEVKE